MRRIVTGLAVMASLALASAPAIACKLSKSNDPKTAQMKVYFTRFPKEDTSAGKYKACRLVKEGGTTFFVTPFRQDATVVVHPDNWPK
jgi:hypothetical protein